MEKDMQQNTTPVSGQMEEVEEEEEEDYSSVVLSDSLDEDVENDEAFEEGNEDYTDESDEENDSLLNKPYPVISAEEERLVQSWSDAYEKMEKPDEIKNHLQTFMDNYPYLVENLGLEEDVLFELGAGYLNEGRIDEYIAFLLQVRQKFPATYIRSAGYYDFDIIAWLISQKRTDEIEQYLNFFKEYPDEFVDKLFDTVNLLMATDTTELVPEFIATIAEKIISSPKVLGGGNIVVPLVIHTMSKYLNEGYTDSDMESFISDLEKNIPHKVIRIENDPIYWKSRLDMIVKPFEKWSESIPKKKSQQAEKYFELSRNFVQYLNKYVGISWISADYYARLMGEFLVEYQEKHHERTKDKHRSFFNFSKNIIDEIISSNSKRFFSPYGPKVLAMLNAVYYFAGYLKECGNYDEKQKSNVQDSCTKLYNEVYPGIKSAYIEALCFPVFPQWEVKGLESR